MICRVEHKLWVKQVVNLNVFNIIIIIINNNNNNNNKHISFDCKCQFDNGKCNSNKKCNKEMRR